MRAGKNQQLKYDKLTGTSTCHTLRVTVHVTRMCMTSARQVVHDRQKPQFGGSSLPRAICVLIIITLPPTRHYHATPTNATLQIATQYQMNINGKKIGQKRGSLSLGSRIAVLVQWKAKLNKKPINGVFYNFLTSSPSSLHPFVTNPFPCLSAHILIKYY